MQTLTLAPTSPPATIIRSRPTRVYVNGRRRRRLEVVSWESLPAPEFGGATLALSLPGPTRQAQDMSDHTRLPSIGAEVCIRPGLRCGGSRMRGTVAAHVVEIHEERERAVAIVRHLLADLLAGTIAGRWELKDAETIEIESTRVCFNSGPSGFASPAVVSVAGLETRVFSGDAQAVRWSVADALAYLFATAAPARVRTPDPDELDQLAGELDLGRVDVTGMPAGEALVKVAGAGGLAIRSARGGLALVVYRPGRSGRRRRVRLQRSGSGLSLSRSNLLRGSITFRRRPSRPAVLAIGQPRRYESTFELSRGWDTSLETYRWRDFVRSKSQDWPTVCDVYRKWVLNEHGRYAGSPWGLSTHDFSDISADDFRTPAPREFLPCISAGDNAQSLGIVVEYRCAYYAAWRRWTGPAWCSSDECAVYLGGDALPGDYFRAAVEQEVEVRVTACVDADARLAAEIAGDPNLPRKVIDYSARAAFRRVHETSAFHERAAAGHADERDDSELLRRLARRHAQILSHADDVKLVLAWIDTTFHAGDIIGRIDGRALELSSNPDSRAFVRSVRHEFGRTQTTTIEVSG